MKCLGNIEVPIAGVKIVRDPNDVINVLCDLPHRSYLLHFLEKSNVPAMFIQRIKYNEAYALILYRYPQWMDEDLPPNESLVMIFLASTLGAMIGFVYLWFNRETDLARKNVIFDIQNLLYERQRIEKEESKKHTMP